MLKISKEKLAAYEKATTAEENRVTVYFDGNRKSFEVYGTYWTGRRRNSAFGWHKVTQADAAEYLKKYGLTVQEFAVIASNEYEEEESVEENTEVSVEENTEVSVEENTEVSVEENTENTVEENTKNELEDKIEEKKLQIIFNIGRITVNRSYIEELSTAGYDKGYVWEPVAKKAASNAQEYMMNAYGEIADLENEIWNLQLEIEEMQKEIAENAVEENVENKVDATADLEEELADVNQQINELAQKAAAIENEIANRKLIEVTGEIVTADAVDASVEAMTAVNFDSQAFNDDAPEVTVEKNVDKEVDVTKLKNELRLAKEYVGKCKRDIAYYSRHILEYYGRIAKCEEFLLKAHLKSLEAEKDVAAIEKKIATAEAIKHGDAKFSFPADTK